MQILYQPDRWKSENMGFMYGTWELETWISWWELLDLSNSEPKLSAYHWFVYRNHSARVPCVPVQILHTSDAQIVLGILKCKLSLRRQIADLMSKCFACQPCFRSFTSWYCQNQGCTFFYYLGKTSEFWFCPNAVHQKSIRNRTSLIIEKRVQLTGSRSMEFIFIPWRKNKYTCPGIIVRLTECYYQLRIQ